jgi:uncharacterized protein (DUF1697 family)
VRTGGAFVSKRRAQWVALIRGINVGKAKRISMAALCKLFSELGCTNVRTVLNSGNVLFESPRVRPAALGRAIQAAIAARCGFEAAVALIAAEELARVVAENPLVAVATDPARHLVGFVAEPQVLDSLKPLLLQSWAPDALAIGRRAAYLWCETGLLDSPLAKHFARRCGASVTTRNWSTVQKLLAAAGAGA